ncbi:MAG: type I 3-dehydroquinate dehydratase [Phycisphaerales bacterium]|nr:type I 3-dehydroquinate dehydratase [Phycisphaerales bacterium]
MTLLCVPILFDDPAQAIASAREARDRGADVVEYRIDAFFTGDAATLAEQTATVMSLVSASPLPCIVTCRPVLEGGQYDGPDDARIALLEHLGASSVPRSGTDPAAQGAAGDEDSSDRTPSSPPAYFDVELATYARSANIKQKINLAVDHPSQLRDVSSGLILSVHDFHTRPPDLIRRIEQMYAEPAARIVKVAYRARSLRDNLELLDILAEVRQRASVLGKPMIALAMGPFGLMSRVLAPKFDAFLTFASLRRNSATAPGQPVINELLDLYRFRSISSTTRVYGVIGYPVEHSLSPLVHNAGFEAMQIDSVYLPLPIPPEYEHFKATLPELIDHVHLDFHGCSVTMPHKENLVRLARELRDEGDSRWKIDPLVERCGAANTLTIDRDPRGNATALTLSNTDASAVWSLLAAVISGGEPAARSAADAPVAPVCILGVGGTARAIASVLLEHGRPVVLLNRTHETAERVASELRATAPVGASISAIRALDLAEVQPCAVINCTPVGMGLGPAPDASPLRESDVGVLPPSCVIVECVYAPLDTPLLRLARARSLRTIDGASMFVRQASDQFERWTGQHAPSQLFDRVVRETLQSARSE